MIVPNAAITCGIMQNNAIRYSVGSVQNWVEPRTTASYTRATLVKRTKADFISRPNLYIITRWKDVPHWSVRSVRSFQPNEYEGYRKPYDRAREFATVSSHSTDAHVLWCLER